MGAWSSPRGAADDLLHRLHLVKVKPVDRAEPGAQRRGHQRQPGRRADQSETRQLQANVACARPLADDDVQRIVLHRRVKHFLHRAAQPVHLVDEQDVALAQVGQDRGQIAGALDGRSRGDLQPDAHLAAEDVCQRSFAQARRPIQQHVIQRLAARARRLDEDLEVLAQAILPHHLGQGARAQCGIHHHFLGTALRRNRAIGHGDLSSKANA